MSSLNEDDGVTNEVRAGKALVAAAQRDRPALVALLAKYGAKKLPDLRLKDLQSFTRECEAIKEPVPPVELTPAFAIGERVRISHFSTPSRVKGYELRYVIAREGDDSLQFGGNGVRADRLERLAPHETHAIGLDFGPPPPVLDRWAMHEIGSALDDVKRARDIGESFTDDGAELLVQLEKAGFRIVRK